MTHLDKLAKSYEVDNFFDYIIESYLNGNFTQVKELAKKLKRAEFAQFCWYAIEYGGRYGRDTVGFLARN